MDKLPEDALALAISYCILPEDAMSVRLVCHGMRGPVASGCRIACAALLGYNPADVEVVTRAEQDEDLVRTAAFVHRAHMAVTPVAASSHTIVASYMGVLACGANASGQLGNGSVSQFASMVVVPGSASYDTASFIARRQSAIEHYDSSSPSPVKLPDNVVRMPWCADGRPSVAAGRGHSLLCMGGDAFVWGEDNSHTVASAESHARSRLAIPRLLAFDDGLTDIDEPTEAVACKLLKRLVPSPHASLPGRPSIVQVAAGQQHSLFLSATGIVFCSGNGTSGELGTGDAASSCSPRRAPLPEAAISIAAGGFHSLALGASASRRVWGWGSAASGQLGITPEHQTGRQPLPRLTPAPVMMGDHAGVHSAPVGLAYPEQSVQTSSGASEGPGDDNGGGASSVEHRGVASARSLPPCMQLAAGSHHSLFLSQGGLVYGCGKSTFGALGFDQRPDVHSPQIITRLAHVRLVAVAAGQAHSAFVSEDGTLYTCGSVANGRLGLAPEVIAQRRRGAPQLSGVPTNPSRTSLREAVARPTAVELPPGVRIRWVAAGDDHTIAVSRDGRTFAFGRGQAGQLGCGHRKELPVPEEVPALAVLPCQPAQGGVKSSPCPAASALPTETAALPAGQSTATERGPSGSHHTSSTATGRGPSGSHHTSSPCWRGGVRGPTTATSPHTVAAAALADRHMPTTDSAAEALLDRGVLDSGLPAVTEAPASLAGPSTAAPPMPEPSTDAPAETAAASLAAELSKTRVTRVLSRW